MNMFKPVGAKTVEKYFEMLTPDRRAAMEFMHTFIRKIVPSLKSNFLYNMPGYGTFQYKNNKKQILDWPVIGLASQKNYISLYICAVREGGYLAEQYKDKLGKVSVGKSCIRFKKIEDLDLETLKSVLKLAEKSPGLVGVEKEGEKD